MNLSIPDFESNDLALTEYRSPKRPLTLRNRYLKARFEPDGDLLWAFSARDSRLIFGRESIHVHKIEGGVRTKGSKGESKVLLFPNKIEFESRPFELVRQVQTLELIPGDSSALLRRVRFSNLEKNPVRLSVISLHDPTSINFRAGTDPPGAIGVNAFSRGDHVAMDDLGDEAGARVVGTTLPPRTIFMTRDKARALELVKRGDLPESVAGASGPIMILTQHEIEIGSRKSAEFKIVSAYNAFGMEEAVATYSGVVSAKGEGISRHDGPAVFFASSCRDLNFAFMWAISALGSVEGELNLFERLEPLSSLTFFSPRVCSEVLAEICALQLKNGSLPHSLDSGKEGVLETAIFLANSSLYLSVLQDKKQFRTLYKSLRKAADYLVKASQLGVVHPDPSLPQGWRRRLTVGYPRGVLPEINLAVAAALREFSAVALSMGRDAEGVRARQASTCLIEGTRQMLVDAESGNLLLNVDERGRGHRDQTIDQVIASYRLPLDPKVTSVLVQRLVERDFETGFGPRTVPTSSPLFANGTYTDGQLGGYWTRAALAHAILCYRVGYPALGSAQLIKVSRLVHGGYVGLPGEFPYWLDPETRTSLGEGSDPVAAARFLEAIIYGELGFSEKEVRAPANSNIKWLLLMNVWLGEEGAFFVGRSAGELRVVGTSARLAAKGALRYKRCERLDTSNPEVVAAQFSEPGQLICLGNLSQLSSSSIVVIPLRDTLLSKQLSAGLQEFDSDLNSWVQKTSVRVLDRMTITVNLRAGDWKILRLSTARPSSLS